MWNLAEWLFRKVMFSPALKHFRTGLGSQTGGLAIVKAYGGENVLIKDGFS